MMAMLLRLLFQLRESAGNKGKQPPKAHNDTKARAAAAQSHRPRHVGASSGEASITTLAHARTGAHAQTALLALRRDMRRAERLARRCKTTLAS